MPADTNRLLRALVDEQCRCVLCFFEERSDPVVDLEDLVDGVTGPQTDPTGAVPGRCRDPVGNTGRPAGRCESDPADAERSRPDPPSATGRDEVRLQLHHSVLPRLDDDGLLEYDGRSGTVRYHGHPALPTLLELAFEPDED